MEIEVGKTYEDTAGALVEIVARNDKPRIPTSEFIGLSCGLGDSGIKHTRTYSRYGASSEHNHIARAHVPFALEVGKAYPTRDGKGYAVVFYLGGHSATVMLVHADYGGHAPYTYKLDGKPAQCDHSTAIDLVRGKVSGAAAAAAAAVLVAHRLMTGEDTLGDPEAPLRDWPMYRGRHFIMRAAP